MLMIEHFHYCPVLSLILKKYKTFKEKLEPYIHMGGGD